MSYRLLFLIGVALLLFSPRSSLETKLPRLQGFMEETEKGGVSSYFTPLARAYIFGNKKGLSKKYLRIHRRLNLMHLMTPSGLHLSSLLLILKPILTKSLFKTILLAMLLMALQWTNHFDSFERMAFFALLRVNPIKTFNQGQSFVLTFLFYFISGQYHQNPLSFTLSFLFLGVLIFGRYRLQIFFLLVLIQSLLCLYFNQSFYFLGAVYGLILSGLSLFLFPALLIETIFRQTFISESWLILLQFIDQLKGPITPTPFYLMTLFYLLYYYPKTRLIFLCLVVFFPIESLTPRKYKAYVSPPPQHYIDRKVTSKKKLIFTYANGMVCRSTLRTDQWSTHCSK
jgi:hypothetical protein